ncbi:hypothetical protein ATO13_20204 [Stappia sp. 22II-S9-Z10]|nr:hypothetical protein ATO13_20204 [Stappia sp. 22II-S9-Z10]
MASKTTLNAKNLEALGAAKLAELALELAQGDAAAKRRLKIALAAAASPGEAAREIRKRLTTIDTSRSRIGWRRMSAFVADLEMQRTAIAGTIGPVDPAEALDLMWRFLSLAPGIFERTEDGSGHVSAVFDNALDDLAALAATVRPSPEALAERVFAALQENDHGQYEGVVGRLAPVLGAGGLAHLKSRLEALGAEADTPPPEDERVVVGWSPAGPLYAHDLERTRRTMTVRLGLRDVAEASGDVDAYIAQYDAKARKVPSIAADLAARLIAAGRAAEALEILAASARSSLPRPPEWDAAKTAALEALDRLDEAQAYRWEGFEATLDPAPLRAFIKRLPDFEDFEAEERAIAFASAHPDALTALAFLTAWPARRAAAALVLSRIAELDGSVYEVLVPAAEALEAEHPLAATLLLRALIDDTLAASRSKRYRHAARHLTTLVALAPRIDNFGPFAPHDAYVARLDEIYRRRSAFWSAVG